MNTAELKKSVFSIRDENEFLSAALKVFRLQAEYNPVYKEYISFLRRDPATVNRLEDIPFLPIGLFKTHRVITGGGVVKMIFESSGTTGSDTSRHFLTDPGLYTESFLNAFRLFYGDPGEYFFAALLPSYLEKGNSSLVFMADRLIQLSSDRRSSFYLNNRGELAAILEKVQSEGRKGMLIGVTYALLDLAEELAPDLSGITVVETGGMKGRRKEITRDELHGILKQKLNIASVHSEYGMTELLSQAWSKGEGLFSAPPWMKILLREINDPLSVFSAPGITGGINVIDLANINSCSFIATGDLGRLNTGKGFEVLGRFGDSDLRGCNLLVG
jgi:hypothetical protein